jgi:hypothetical protein
MSIHAKVAARFGPSLAAILFALIVSQPITAAEPEPLELFNQRIMPIFQSQNPSSCVQCHLSSVDLKNYILPSSDATFVSLRDQGLVDLEHPEQSKILDLIHMGAKDLDEAAKLIHEKTRNSELEAFSAWVQACCRDPRMRELPTSAKLAKPAVPNEVIRHARKSRVVDSFVRNVWSQRLRCFPCHTPHEINADNPRHQAAVKTRKKLKEEYGEEMLNRLEIFRETPEATFRYLVASSASTPNDRLPLLDLAKPTESLFIQKPMSKLPKKKPDGTFEEPTYRFPLTHMGGLKLHPNDQTYKSFVAWIQDYAKVVDGDYMSVDELPADNWYSSQMVVRVMAAPDSWQVGDLVQLFVHAWNEEQRSWQHEPVAFTQGTVTPRRLVNGALFLLGSGDEQQTAAWKREATLPRGRYLVKAYLDSKHKVTKNPAVILTTDDYYGEAEIPKARWREGFKFAEAVSGSELEKSKQLSQ